MMFYEVAVAGEAKYECNITFCTAPIRLDLPYLEFSIGMIDHLHRKAFRCLIEISCCLDGSDVAGLIQTPKPSFTLFVAGDNSRQAFFNRDASSLGLAPGVTNALRHWIIYTIH